MIVFVGAGPGAEDLITVRGQQYLKEADIIIYAGSLVNPGLLQVKKEGCEVYNSAYMTLEEVLEVMYAGEKEGKRIVRLHTGDPCLYGAIESRWMLWKSVRFRTKYVRVSVLFAEQQQRYMQNIHCLIFPSLW